MKKPNIILITADQMRADCYGIKNNEIVTPNLDYISKNGVDFNNSYCTSPTCTPSRAALFTGRYPENTGAWNIGVSLNEDELTLADYLKNLNYTNIAVGKMHFRPQMKNHDGEYEDVEIRDRKRERDNTYYGFDKYYITEDDKRGKYLNGLKKKGIKINGGKGKNGINPLQEKDTQTYKIGEKSIEAINNHNFDKSPLFMWTSFVDPHHPFDPIQKFVDLYDDLGERNIIENGNIHLKRPLHLQRQGEQGYWPGGGEKHNLNKKELNEIVKYYYAMISFIDQEIGKIIESLKNKNEFENTIIIFTSDHGEYLGDHGLLTKGPFLKEGLNKVPLIIYGPGIMKKNEETIVENVDIVPTLLELINSEIPYGIQGQSLKNILEGKKLLINKGAITTYDAHDRGIFIKSYRNDRYKLVIYQGEEYGELFDLKNDPEELKNLYFDEKFEKQKGKILLELCNRLIVDSDPLPERKASW